MIVRMLICVTLCAAALSLQAGDVRQMIREGNRLFEQEQYAGAEEKYRQALTLDEDNKNALFNLGNALYMQGHLDEAQAIFESLSHDFDEPQKLTDALHNLGNSFLGQQRIPESIEAYKDALRIAPDQEDTRYNLAYARRLLEEMPPQDQPGPDQEPSGEDGPEGEPDHGKDDAAPDPDDMHDQQDEGMDEDQPVDQEPTPLDDTDDSPPRMDELTKEDAGRILEALLRDEERVQREVNRDDTIPDTLQINKEW